MNKKHLLINLIFALILGGVGCNKKIYQPAVVNIDEQVVIAPSSSDSVATRPPPPVAKQPDLFNLNHIEDVAYIQEDSLIKLPDIDLQIMFPPSTTLSEKFSLRVVTADSVRNKLQQYKDRLDEIQKYSIGTETPTYEVDKMDINFFNQEEVNFAAKKSFMYHGRSDVGGEEDYKITSRKINDICYLVYDMDLVFDNTFRVYSTFIGNKRLDIILTATRTGGWAKELDALFSQIKLIPFNPKTGGSANKGTFSEQDLQKGTLYPDRTVEMARNDTEGIFKLNINPTLPTYTFRVFAANGTQKGQIEIYDTANSLNPKQIVVFDPNLFGAREAPLDFAVNDINFDGFLDIGLRAGGGAKWAWFQYWTFDQKTGLFVISPIAQDFRQISFNQIQFDSKNKRIIANNFDGTLLAYKYIYSVEQDRLKLIQQEYQQPVYKDGNLIKECNITVSKFKGSWPESSTEVSDNYCTGYGWAE